MQNQKNHNKVLAARAIPYGEIADIQLFVADGDNSRIESQVHVHYAEATKDHAAMTSGIVDIRMGTTERRIPCGTCMLDYQHDPGHSGDLELNSPVINPLFRAELARWLKVICFRCHGLIFTLPNLKLPENHILREYARKANVAGKNTKCTNQVGVDADGKPVYCGAEHPKVGKDSRTDRFFTEMYSDDDLKDNEKAPLYPHQMLAILDPVSEETYRKMGRHWHPRRLLLTNLRIPANQIRPEAKVVNSNKSKNNDLTTLLSNIVKANQAIGPKRTWTFDTPMNPKEKGGLGQLVDNLNFAVHAYIKGSTGNKVKVVGSGNRELTPVAKRLPGKFGRIRRNILGRRVRVTSRSFITCDNTLRLNEVGFPRSECKKIQRPEPVRSYNYDQMMVYFSNGPTKYPGASGVIKASTGHFAKLGYPDANLRLEVGDILFRDIVSNDMIGFNRQPSLEPSSMTAQKAKIMSHSTFRINLQIVDFYNADFDGDAMMCVFPNSSRTQNEVEMLAGPEQFFISYKEAKPKVGNAHDSLIGLALMTRGTTRINKYHAMGMLSNTPVYYDFSQDDPNKLYSGRDVVSMLLQGTGCYINYKGKPNFYKEEYKAWIPYRDDDIKVEIDRGRVKSGVLDGASLAGGAVKGIYHIIHNQFGAQAALDASFNMQQMALTFIGSRGFTIDLQSILPAKETLDVIHKIEHDMIAASENTTRKLNRGEIIPPLGSTVAEHYEATIVGTDLKPGDRFWAPLFKDTDALNNGLLLDILHKVKGNIKNFKNTNSAIGCLEVNGRRFPEVFDHRCMPYLHRYDPHPSSRGFVANGYNKGLDPVEFMFHAMEARYQIVARALGTSKTGYQNRMSVKNLEAHIIDNQRRLSNGQRVIQPVYGGDGADPRFVVPVSIPTVKSSLTTAELEEKFKCTAKHFGLGSSAKSTVKVAKPTSKPKKGKGESSSDEDSIIMGGAKESNTDKTPKSPLEQALQEEFAQILADRHWYQDVNMRLEMSSNLTYRDEVNSPVDVARIIDDVIYDLGQRDKKTDKPQFDPVSAIRKVQQLCENLPYCLLNSIQERRKGPIPEHLQHAVGMLRVLIRSYLNCRTMINYNFNDAALDLVISGIRTAYMNSLVSYGSSMGIIAAQSISEPSTQMVLDSHQTSGQGSTKKKGLDRMKDILSAKDTDKLKGGATMVLHVLEKYRTDEAKVKEIASIIEMLKLRQFYTSWQVFYEQFGKPVHPEYVREAATIAEFTKYHPTLKQPTDLANWCIRISLDKSTLIEKHMRMDQIYQAIRLAMPNTFVVYTNDNDRNPLLRVYFRTAMFEKGITVNRMIETVEALLNLTVRGVPGIIGTQIAKMDKHHTRLPDGSLSAQKIYYITTTGTNMEAILKLPYFDHNYTQSDSIQEVYRMCGISAANTKIVQELTLVVADKCDVAHRHYTVYADEMTFSGLVTSIDRYGSAKRDASFMLRISDSSPLAVIEEIALVNAKDRLSGVSPPIMLGKNPRVGDLYNSFLLNEAFIRKRMGSTNLADMLVA